MNPNMSGESEKRIVVKGNASKYVKLNVGGNLFYTTIGTLTKYDSMLKAMFSGRMEVLTDPEGWILIDRCGSHFQTVLNFLRDGEVTLPESLPELFALQAEAKYYLVQELQNEIQSRIDILEREKGQPRSNIILSKSPSESQRIIQNTTKVEFPDARIWEETCNVLLYETADKPDTDLLSMIRGSAAACSDDDEDVPPPPAPSGKNRRK